MAGNLIRCDNGYNLIRKHDGFSAAQIDCFSSPSNSPTDISWDGTNVLTSDYTSDFIYKHTGFSSTIADSISAPIFPGNPEGITWDGTNLISSNWPTDQFFKHAGFSETIDDSFSAAQTGSGRGLAWDGTNLIAGQYQTRLIFKYLGFSSTLVDSISGPGVSNDYAPGWDGANLLLGFRSGGDRLYKMSGWSENVTDSFTVIYAEGLADDSWSGQGPVATSSSSSISSSSQTSTSSSVSSSSASSTSTSSSSSSSTWTGTSSTSSSTSTSSSSSTIFPLTYDEFNDGATDPVWFFEDQSPSQDGSHDEPAGGAGIHEITAGDGRVWGDGAGSYSFTPTWLHQPVSGDFDVYLGLDTSIPLDDNVQRAGLVFRLDDLNWVAIYRSYLGPGAGNVIRATHCANGFTYDSGTVGLGPLVSPRTYGYVRLQRIGQYIYAYGKEYAKDSWTQLQPFARLETTADGHLAPFATYYDATQYTAEFDFFRDLTSQSHSYSSSTSSTSSSTSSTSTATSSVTSTSSSSSLNPVAVYYDDADTEIVYEIRKNIVFKGTITDPIELHLWNDKDGVFGVNTIMKEVRISAQCSTGVWTGEENSVGQEQVTERWLECRSNGKQGTYLTPEYFDDDAQAAWTPIGGVPVMYPGGDESAIEDNYLEVGMIPPNCARHLHFRWNVPSSADTVYSSYVTVQATYKIYHIAYPFSTSTTSTSISWTTTSSSSLSSSSSSITSSSSSSSVSSTTTSTTASSTSSSTSSSISTTSSSSSFSFTGSTASSSVSSTSYSSTSSSSSITTTSSSSSSSSLQPNLLSIDRDTDDVYRHSGFASSISECFSTPGIQPGGVGWDGTNLLTSEESTSIIYKHDGFSPSILDCFSSPHPSVYGISWYDSDLYSVTGSVSGQFYQHTGWSTSITDCFSSLSNNPRDVGFKGSNLISTDAGTQLCYEHSGFSPSIVDSVTTSDQWPYGCHWDGTDLWIAGFNLDRIYQHDGFSTSILDSFSSPGGWPDGLDSDA